MSYKRVSGYTAVLFASRHDAETPYCGCAGRAGAAIIRSVKVVHRAAQRFQEGGTTCIQAIDIGSLPRC
jgi:hypothetical protein